MYCFMETDSNQQHIYSSAPVVIIKLYWLTRYTLKVVIAFTEKHLNLSYSVM